MNIRHYFRYEDFELLGKDGEIVNKHTVAYDYNPMNRAELFVAFAFCNPKEKNFSKKNGCATAVERLQKLQLMVGRGDDVFKDICHYNPHGEKRIWEYDYDVITKVFHKRVLTCVPYTLVLPFDYFLRLKYPDNYYADGRTKVAHGFYIPEFDNLNYDIIAKDGYNEVFSRFSADYFDAFDYADANSHTPWGTNPWESQKN